MGGKEVNLYVCGECGWGRKLMCMYEEGGVCKRLACMCGGGGGRG